LRVQVMSPDSAALHPGYGLLDYGQDLDNGLLDYGLHLDYGYCLPLLERGGVARRAGVVLVSER